MSFPRFAEPIPNVTVTVGRDALLACVVDNLRGFKVRRAGGGWRVRGSRDGSPCGDYWIDRIQKSSFFVCSTMHDIGGARICVKGAEY